MLDLFPNSLRDLAETAVRRYVTRLVRFITVMIIGLTGLVLIIFGTDVLVSLGLGETVAKYLTRGVVIGGSIVAVAVYVWRSET
jgi:hypothetical protein